jgi:hypothetical protein
LARHPKVVNKKAAPNEKSGDFIAKLHVYLTALGSHQKRLQIKFLTKKNQVKSTLLNYKACNSLLPQSFHKSTKFPK